MADRVLRGSRLGAVSYETDTNHDPAPGRSRGIAPRTVRSLRFRSPTTPRFRAPGCAATGWREPSSRVNSGAEEGQAAQDALGHAAGAPLD